jgi:hypothetical protein
MRITQGKEEKRSFWISQHIGDRRNLETSPPQILGLGG